MRARRHCVCPGAAPAALLAAGAVVLLALLGALVGARAAGREGGKPVYTVAALRAHLRQDPQAWVDRPLLVRAVPFYVWCFAWTRPTPSCLVWEPALLNTDINPASALPLVRARTPALLASLRRLPLLGRLAPAPQAIRWGAPGTYRVQLRAVPCFRPGTSGCYAAAVLDSAP